MKNALRWAWLLVLLVLVWAPLSCKDDKVDDDDDDLVPTDGDLDGDQPQFCQEDADCDVGDVCVEGICESLHPTDDDDDDVDLDGDDTGTPSLIAPTTVEFGAVVINNFVERPVTLANNGDGNLVLSKIEFDRATSDEFELVTTVEANQVIEPNDDLVLTIRYTPVDAGKDLGVLEVTTNDPDKSLVKIDLVTDYKGIPNLLVEPTSLTFEQTPIGETAATQCISISNEIDEGNRVLEINNITLQSGVNTYFEIVEPVHTLPMLLLPGSPKQVCVSYHPPATGEHSDALVIGNDDPDEADREKSVSLTGEGVAGHLTVSPTSLPFGPVLVDETLTLQVELSNTGLADLTISAIGTGDGEGPFSSVVNREAGAPWVLTPGSDMTVDVTFAPTQQGAASGALTVDSDDPDQIQASVALSGEGRRPSVVITPPQASFVDTRLGEQSEVTLNLRRVAADVRITGLTWNVAEPPFSLSEGSSLPLDLNDDANHPLVFVFSPDMQAGHLGDQEAIATLVTEPVLEAAQTIVFTGKGVASEIRTDVNGDLDFGLVRLGESIERSFDVENFGLASLHVSSITFTEDSHAGFSLVSPANGQMTVMAVTGAKGTVTLRLSLTDADATGELEGTVVVASDDWDTPTVEIPLRAEAINPLLSVTPDTNPFNIGGVRVGTSSEWHSFQVSNIGEGNLILDSIRLSSESLSQGFEIQGVPESFPVTLAPGGAEAGQTVTVEVRYTASEEGVAEGVLEILSNDYQQTSFSQGLRAFGSSCNDETEVFCNGSCVSRFSVEHCGAECTVCEAQANANAGCDGTQCTLICQGTNKDCNGIYDDGCEVNTASHVSHCGACESACDLAHADYHCENSQCVVDQCIGSWRDCDELDSSGCETDVISGGNPSHCGGCNVTCPGITNGTPSCASGMCIVGSCSGNFRDCNYEYDDGCEVDIIDGGDLTNCGSCNYTCPTYAHSNMACVEGGCAIASCVGLWNNCDGRLDNGCEKDTSDDIENCGGCSSAGNDFAFQCDLDHVQNHVCTGGTCGVAACESGWVNLDGQAANGCECQNFGYDDPDDDYLDTNCDGMDGTIDAGFFVAVDRGLDTNPGTAAFPFKTIQKGIDSAMLNGGSQVFVAAGTYTESLTLKSGVSLFGGFSSSDWSRNLMLETRVVGAENKTVVAQDLTANVTVDSFTFEGKDFTSNGTSTYTLWVRNVPTQFLTVRNSRIIGGDAGDGYDGVAGSNGATGNAGRSATSRYGASGGTVSCGANGGGGGGAWDCGNSSGTAGSNGSSGTTVGNGGASGSNKCGGCDDEGGNGSRGGNGSYGSHGLAGTPNNTLQGDMFAGLWFGVEGNLGTNGKHGGGGGGGGAGGTDEDPWTCVFWSGTEEGGGGGGGGAAGCGGTAGRGGSQGGGSFAVIISSSHIVMEHVEIVLGNGGVGGHGGTGGDGGGGQIGGGGHNPSDDEAGTGGGGGTGGDGGGGGGGAGGNGGPAVGIAFEESSQCTSTDVTYENTTAPGAAGGSGGDGGRRDTSYSWAPDGQSGLAGLRSMTYTY